MTNKAARFLDTSSHPGLIVSGDWTVWIEGLPAATAGSWHICAMPPTAGPHGPSQVIGGSATVWIGGRRAARVGDAIGCGATITSGAANVEIGG